MTVSLCDMWHVSALFFFQIQQSSTRIHNGINIYNTEEQLQNQQKNLTKLTRPLSPTKLKQTPIYTISINPNLLFFQQYLHIYIPCTILGAIGGNNHLAPGYLKIQLFIYWLHDP